MVFFRRLPLLAILVIGICSLFLVVNYNHQKAVLEEQYKSVVIAREKTIKLFTTLGQNLGSKNLWDDVQVALEKARLDKQIDFYVLQFQGNAVWFGSKDESVKNLEGHFPEGEYISNELSIDTVNVGADYRLTVGIQKNLQEFRAENSRHMIMVTLEECYYIVFLVFVVGLWALKDLMLIVREVRRGKRGNLKNLKTHSAETKAFVQGFTGYAQAVEDLQSENRKLGRQVLPSLQKEIFSGRKPPYDFHCTMVRTDINHFSTIYNTYNVTEFMSTINNFFDEVSQIVARYGGLVHEFVGDEVIYYFKDEDHKNSFATALSAIRDVNMAAERFHGEVQAERGYSFTVKSSLAHGKVRFGPLVNGFTIAGSVLIETVRILSYIQERHENTVYFDGAHAPRLGTAIASEERHRVRLKGYKSEIALYEYRGHRGLSAVIETMSETSIDELAFYRSDTDIASLLQNLRSEVKNRDLSVTLLAINSLREPYIARSSLDFGLIITDWLKELRTQFEDDAFLGADKVLSAVTKLLMNLVPKQELRASYRDQIRELLDCVDRRVVANAVEVLTYFSVELDGRQIKRLQSNDLRTTANAIVFEGRDELSPPVLKKLSGLVKSKKPTEIASGLYALGELAIFHRERDASSYAVQSDFAELVQKLDFFVQHPTTSVRKQALIAAKKADDRLVIERIRRHVIETGSDLMREELDRYLGTSAPVSFVKVS